MTWILGVSYFERDDDIGNKNLEAAIFGKIADH